jgi:hypothetical protein
MVVLSRIKQGMTCDHLFSVSSDIQAASTTQSSTAATSQVKEGKKLETGFPPFKASQFQDLFKTFSRLNYLLLEIKTQLIRFGQILTKHQVNQIIWNDVPIAPE